MNTKHSYWWAVLAFVLAFLFGACLQFVLINLARLNHQPQTISLQSIRNITLEETQVFVTDSTNSGDNSTTSGNGEVTTFVRTFQVSTKYNFDIFCNDPDNTQLCYGGVDATDGSTYKSNFAGKFGQANHNTFDQLVVGEWYTCKVIPDLQNQLENVYYIVSACAKAN